MSNARKSEDGFVEPDKGDDEGYARPLPLRSVGCSKAEFDDREAPDCEFELNRTESCSVARERADSVFDDYHGSLVSK